MTDDEPKENYSSLLVFLVPVVLGFFPCGLFVLLTIINADYMAQLLKGPPVGVYIPGTPIPMGWPFILVIILLIAIAIGINLLFSRWAVKNDLEPKLKAVLIIAAFTIASLVTQSLACTIVILGPSFIQLFKAFF